MREICLFLGIVVLAMAVPRAQPPQRPDNVANAKVTEIIATYGAAWNEPDEAKRRALLEKAWATNGTYTDPSAHVEGRDALMQHIGGFVKSMPGGRIVVTSAVDVHHNMFRFSWRLIRPDGATATEGIDFGTLDADGRISRIVGFFGPLSPMDR